MSCRSCHPLSHYCSCFALTISSSLINHIINTLKPKYLKVGELKRGELVFLIESQEVAPATWRARIAIELGGTAKGWVTQSRSGTEFLIAEGSPGSACLTQAQKNKFHFFSFQLGRTDSAC